MVKSSGANGSAVIIAHLPTAVRPNGTTLICCTASKRFDRSASD
jgi:hypothetical protein